MKIIKFLIVVVIPQSIVVVTFLMLCFKMDHNNDINNESFNAINGRLLYVPRVRTSSQRYSQNRLTRSEHEIEPTRKWPQGIVFYQISDSLAKFRSLIKTAMKRIQSETCIVFQKRKSKYQKDYIFLVDGNGCHSVVGRARGRQIVSLGSGCHDVGSIIHELCHAIGLYHEHMRYDRDQYLHIKWRNIDPLMYDQFEKIPITEYRPAHKFDYNSIMIYGSKAFSKNGRDTMVPRDPKASIQESHHKRKLSKADIININSLYSC